MHIVDLLVAQGGDPMNKIFKPNVTVPELIVLRSLHGMDSIGEIQIRKNKRANHEAERERLLQAYPTAHEFIIGLWRDQGGKFPTDIRELKLPSTYFAAEQHVIDASMDAADIGLGEDQAEIA